MEENSDQLIEFEDTHKGRRAMFLSLIGDMAILKNRVGILERQQKPVDRENEAESNQVSFYDSDALSDLLNRICEAFNCAGKLSRLEFWDIVGEWSIDHNGSIAAGTYYAFHGFRKDNKGISMKGLVDGT